MTALERLTELREALDKPVTRPYPIFMHESLRELVCIMGQWIGEEGATPARGPLTNEPLGPLGIPEAHVEWMMAKARVSEGLVALSGVRGMLRRLRDRAAPRHKRVYEEALGEVERMEAALEARDPGPPPMAPSPPSLPLPDAGGDRGDTG